jgi:uncharacterized protein YwlG (UPF0340 family)
MRRNIGLIAVALLIFASGVATAQLDKILKGGGIAFLVSQFGKDINKGINQLTRTKDRTSTYATKVVPIISAGTGTQVGAVQVMGPPSQVDKVSAVAQLEGNFRALDIRIRALVPVATKNITNIKRIPGVGISGLIDVKL